MISLWYLTTEGKECFDIRNYILDLESDGWSAEASRISHLAVLGVLDPEELGITLTHEHLLHDLPEAVFNKPLPSFMPKTLSADSTISLETLGWIRQYPYCFKVNNSFADAAVRDTILEEMKFFKQSSGGTIVDNGSIGIRAEDQAQFLKDISRRSGVNIVLGTGFYVTTSQTLATLNMSQENMEVKMRQDILDGVNNTGIKCGVIGEVGSSWPLEPFEKRSLVASAAVQAETGCPVIIHPGRDPKAPEEIIRIFQEAGGKTARTVMSHLDRTLLREEDLLEFAALGSYCEFDLFGVEVSHYQPEPQTDMPSDSQRIARMHALLQGGYGDKIVIAHDIHTKHRLMKFGGHGYSHILLHVLPRMLQRGFTAKDIDKILVQNPKNLLTFQ